MLIRRVHERCDLAALQQRAPQRYPCLLQSVARGNARARYDLLLAAAPGGLRLDADGITRTLDGRVEPGSFLQVLDREWHAARAARSAETEALPFIGGWALYLGYELAAQIETSLRLPPAAGGIPCALALRCPAALLHDLEHDELLAIAEPANEPMLMRVMQDFRLAAAQPATQARGPLLTRLCEDDPDQFLAAVGRTLDYIAAGDVFQVNLSRGWEAGLADGVDFAGVYAALRDANPAPFAASFVHRDWAVLSSSPERLVAVRDRRIETRPIAGTRARVAGEDEAARMRELLGHPKERAEHIMLIDLERNYLGRVSVPGSIEVDELMTVESYTHVHHIVSNVRGQLRPAVTPGEVVAAVFPGGTITGCPKVRCMQIIAQLERIGRGPYTGAIGYLDRRGDMDLNILIRTLWMDGSRLRFRAGAGIVADSNADAELAETRAKARGLLHALGIRT